MLHQKKNYTICLLLKGYRYIQMILADSHLLFIIVVLLRFTQFYSQAIQKLGIHGEYYYYYYKYNQKNFFSLRLCVGMKCESKRFSDNRVTRLKRMLCPTIDGLINFMVNGSRVK